MDSKRFILVGVLLLVLVPMLVQGQELRLTPWIGAGSQYLNQQIAADTAANGKLANRVYVLQRGALYLSNAVFTNTGNWTLRLKANDSSTTKKPVIMLYPTGTGATPWNPPGNLFVLNGSLELKNLQITGYYELVDTNRWNMQGALINIPSTISGPRIIIDSCILSNSNGNHVRTDGTPSTIKVTNSLFANMGYNGRSNFGAGKAFDLRASSCDSLILENNTFVNWQDRIVRHYPNSTGGFVGGITLFVFDHNTLVNGTSYHGLLSLGATGRRMVITNNLLIDPFAMGNDSDVTRQAEFIPSGEKDQFGQARMNWIFSYPNDATSWKIANNYYSISDSGQAFFTAYASAGVTGEGSPLTWYINKRPGVDSVNAFKKVSVSLTKIPALMTQLMRWYRSPSGGKKTKNTPGAWTYGTATDPNDFDRKGYAWLRDSLNCAYSTSSTLYTAASNGLPVGDLSWFPSKKAIWTADPYTGVGQTSTTIPVQYSLGQNYPNPFNPTTRIEFSLPKQSYVRLEVFDMLGKKIATLVNGAQPAGEYKVDFDATKFVSGVYIYRLSIPDRMLSKKMILLK